MKVGKLQRAVQIRPTEAFHPDRDGGLSRQIIGDNLGLLPIIVIAQNSFDLSITDIAFVICFVIADKLSR